MTLIHPASAAAARLAGHRDLLPTTLPAALDGFKVLYTQILIEEDLILTLVGQE